MATGYKILIAIVFMLSLVLGGAWGYHHIYSLGYDAGVTAQQAKNKIEKLETAEENTKRYNDIADELLKEKAKRKVVYKTITKEVEKIVDRPVYKTECVDTDGVDLINKALRGE